MSPFNPEEYWKDKLHKVWVVDVTATFRELGKKKSKSRRMYIRAKTPEGARRTAKYHCTLKGRLGSTARLATPTDLGCVPTPQAKD